MINLLRLILTVGYSGHLTISNLSSALENHKSVTDYVKLNTSLSKGKPHIQSHSAPRLLNNGFLFTL